jgi:esterase/lipase superfamily enzyme
MRTRRSIRSAGWALLIALVAVSAPAQGGTLLDLSLQPDGSFDPPGDRISLSVVFEGDEPVLTLEVRAFLVDGGEGDPPVPVRAARDDHRDANGRFLLTRELRRPENSRLLEVSVVVPYRSLDIPLGRHRYGYEVRGTRDGVVAFLSLTGLNTVQIRDFPRREMLVPVETKRVVSRQLEFRVFQQQAGRDVAEESFVMPRSEAVASTSTRRVNVEIPGGFVHAGTGRDPSAPPAAPRPLLLPSSAGDPQRNRIVHFATNRNVRATQGSPGERFGNDLGDGVTYGTCLVNIPLPAFHTPGEVERPSWFNFWNARDPDRYFLIEATTILEPPAFLASLRIEGKPGDILVFVHGYNTKFDDMIFRSAQMAHDTGFQGRVVMFGWPSAGSLTGYARDEGMARASGSALAEVLLALAQDRQARQGGPAGGKIYLVAHSMGNRVLLDALNLVARVPGIGKPFADVILAAPDVDILDFTEQSMVLNDLSDAVTLYSCSADAALKASRGVHTARRLGEQPFFSRGLALENVNADNANTEFLGHGYIVSAEKVLKDLRLLLLLRLRADNRPTLVGATTPRGSRFWIFR